MCVAKSRPRRRRRALSGPRGTTCRGESAGGTLLTITNRQRLSSDRPHKRHRRHADPDGDQQAFAGRRRPVNRRRVRRRLAGRRTLQHALEPGQCKTLIEVDRPGEGPYLCAAVESARYCRQVVSFDRLEMAPRNFRLVRDLFEGETAAFTGVPQKLTEPAGIVLGREGGRQAIVPGIVENLGHWSSLTLRRAAAESGVAVDVPPEPLIRPPVHGPASARSNCRSGPASDSTRTRQVWSVSI